MKKRGFGVGWWNGFGGKVQEGESVKQAAIREVMEESGIIVKNLQPRGILNFTFEGKDDIQEAFLFDTSEFEGEPQETEEMLPQWFELSNLPYDKMWPADRIWIPIYLKEGQINGTFHFDRDLQVASYNIEKIKTK